MTTEQLKAEADHIASLYTPAGCVEVLSITMQKLALRFAREEIASMRQTAASSGTLDMVQLADTACGGPK